MAAAAEMDGEEIGLVLARASDLRTRISACAAAAAGAPCPRRDDEEAAKRLDAAEGDEEGAEEEEDEEEEEEVGSLVGISDALESLERQLAALQDLQHQQRYERETILSQIDRSRRSLLAKLREYKGQDCEVIHEAAAFAGERIERDDGLVLPPYSDHVTNSFALDDLYPLSYMSKPKRLHTQPDSDGDDDGTAQDGARRNGRESRDTGASKRGSGGGAGGGGGGIGAFMGWVAKTAVMVVGAVCVMKAAGYESVTWRNGGARLDIAGLFGGGGGKQAVAAGGGDERRVPLRCPPGKALVVENGRARCVVKERVEVPFDAVLAPPSSRYGLG